MPKLWSETIEAHRREVRDAILEATVALVGEQGVASVTMSQIAEATGIGRATLYKYFPDVESILTTWHERQVHVHLEALARVRGQSGRPGERLAAVLESYALMAHEARRHHRADLGELAALLHRGDHAQRGEHVAQAREQLSAFIQDVLTEAATAGEVRDDVPPDELASYCIHALAAAGDLPSPEAVRRLVAVTLAGLLPPVRPSVLAPR